MCTAPAGMWSLPLWTWSHTAGAQQSFGIACTLLDYTVREGGSPTSTQRARLRLGCGVFVSGLSGWEVAPHPRNVHGSGWDVESSTQDLNRVHSRASASRALYGRLHSEDAPQSFGSRAFCWAVCRRCTAELRLAGTMLGYSFGLHNGTHSRASASRAFRWIAPWFTRPSRSGPSARASTASATCAMRVRKHKRDSGLCHC